MPEVVVQTNTDCIDGDNFVFLLVEEKTGFMIAHKAGGIECALPEAEGYLLPLPDEYMGLELPKDVGDEFPGTVAQVFTMFGLVLDGERNKMEAWLPVKLHPASTLPDYLRQKKLWLIYPNSD